MRVVTLAEPDDFDGWRDAARALAAEGVPPDDVVWQVGGEANDLFGGGDPIPSPAAALPAPGFSVPRQFLDLARSVALASDPERFALLYTLLYPPAPRAGADRGSRRSADAPARHAGQRRAPRHPQDARVPAFSRGGGGGRPPLRRLVRARAPHRPRQRRLLRQPLRLDALVDPDAGSLAPLGWQGAERRARRHQGGRAGRRPDRGGVEDLLRQHLQPRPRQDRRDAEGDAAQILEEHARDRARPRPDRRRSSQGIRDDRHRPRRHRRQQHGGVGGAARRGGGVHPLPAVQAGDADGVRRGAGRCAADVRRRAARRPGGPRRPAVRRPRRPAVRPRAGRGRRRPQPRLRHQRGQALQVRTARQAAHPLQARRRRDRGVPLVDRAGAHDREARGDGGAGRDRGALAVRPGGDDRPRTGPAAGPARRAARRSSPSIPASCCACPTRPRGPRNMPASSRS